MNATIIRGGTLVTDTGRAVADVAIDDGRIVATGHDLGGAREVIDASGLCVLPGVIDVHVHFNEPGRTEWEGAATGSQALAAGGGTVFFDMPLNSTPCTVTPRDFDRKRTALEASSVADFGIWGALVPGAVPEMAAMAERGVVGFKAFMCDSGLPEFAAADDRTLFDGLVEGARLGLPVAVHAENEALTRSRRSPGEPLSPAEWCRSRPVLAEAEAIARAVLLAGEAGARLHIVHVSSGRGVAVAADARAQGVDVSIETCPHYLYFTDDDLDRLGALAKCAPPLRPPRVQESLWRELLDGRIDIVASDHSPATPALKTAPFGEAWGGIAGVQSTLAVLLDRAHHARGVPLEVLVGWTSARPARRFRLADKGTLTPGADADLVLVNLADTQTLEARHLRQRHPLSPYIGCTFRGLVTRTIRRGETISIDGRPVATGGGRLVRPAR